MKLLRSRFAALVVSLALAFGAVACDGAQQQIEDPVPTAFIEP